MGVLVFSASLCLSAFQSLQTHFSDIFWPQTARGFAILFCMLPATRLALGHIELSHMFYASGLFNLM